MNHGKRTNPELCLPPLLVPKEKDPVIVMMICKEFHVKEYESYNFLCEYCS